MFVALEECDLFPMIVPVSLILVLSILFCVKVVDFPLVSLFLGDIGCHA